MPFKIVANDGKKIVLRQSYQAKIALYFSDKYHFVNAYNLAILAQESYKEFKESDRKLRQLYINHIIPPSKNPNDPKPKSFISEPFLAPYFGEKEHATDPVTKIIAEATGFENLKSLKNAMIDTQAFHYNDGTYNVFVFRGTAGPKDLLCDFFAPKVVMQGGKVHEGFYDNFYAVKDQINTILIEPLVYRCSTDASFFGNNFHRGGPGLA